MRPSESPPSPGDRLRAWGVDAEALSPAPAPRPLHVSVVSDPVWAAGCRCPFSRRRTEARGPGPWFRVPRLAGAGLPPDPGAGPPASLATSGVKRASCAAPSTRGAHSTSDPSDRPPTRFSGVKTEAQRPKGPTETAAPTALFGDGFLLCGGGSFPVGPPRPPRATAPNGLVRCTLPLSEPSLWADPCTLTPRPGRLSLGHSSAAAVLAQWG